MGEPEVKTDARPEAKPAPTRHRKYMVGDIDLISSDNTLFKVHKYQLMAAGAGFRDILTNPHASKIAEGEGGEVTPIQLELVDKTIETARVVESFLNFLSIGSISVAEWTGVLLVRDTLQFARKWQCAAVVRLLLDLSRLSLLADNTYKHPSWFFGIGADHEDVALCSTAIRQSGAWCWGKGSQYAGGDRGESPMMDPTTWEEEDFERNPRYFWALTVASRGEMGYIAARERTERWKRIADRFETIVKYKK